jgi:glyoxylase-like metal-dependent hydrolase (beta-lactamase superfamily II)
MKQFITNSDIYTIDSLYLKEQLDAIYLIKQGEQLALVDTGTQHSLPQVEKAIKSLGLDWQHVKFIILTHVHLDHAGGASALMQKCENATLVVHPRGARHMINPDKLIAGTKAVYGADKFEQMYGDIGPIDQDRVFTPEDGLSIDLNGRVLRFIDSPGHAYHHHCILDETTGGIFTGDAMGISYVPFKTDRHSFLLPTTTPVQFDPDAMHETIDKVMSFQPSVLYLTHYDGVVPTATMIAGLHQKVDDYVVLTEQAAKQVEEMDDANSKTNMDAQLEEQITRNMYEYLVRSCKNELPDCPDAVMQEWLSIDAKLNAQGLAFWWQHRRVA